MSDSSEYSRTKPLPQGERLERGLFPFNSKLLLFGEYGLMYNAMALAVPFPKFNGRLAFDLKGEHRESTAEIRKFCGYLKHESSGISFPFDLERMENDLDNGLYFDSGIPQQYGLGSSGALVAALFSRYASVPEQEETPPEALKSDFSRLESYFHGRSSGLDPLISYLNKPVLIDSEKRILTVDFDLTKTGVAMALIDTQTTGATGPLVQHFINLFNFLEFEHAFEQQFIPSNNACIESILHGNLPVFFQNLERLVRFEAYHFHEMIPAGFHRVISHAVCGKVYIKLLGSGGGGFLLAIAESDKLLINWAARHGIRLTKIV